MPPAFDARRDDRRKCSTGSSTTCRCRGRYGRSGSSSSWGIRPSRCSRGRRWESRSRSPVRGFWTEEGELVERILDRIESPKDLKKLSEADLLVLCQELRDQIIETVTKTGGHLGASLGAVELTVAIHRVFDAPTDRLVWDVGHQAYGHKLLTGRRDRFGTIRQYGGLSGFPVRAESEYDTFGVAHAGTSISAGLGMATALAAQQKDARVLCVIGDGGLTCGMAFE